MINMKKKQIDQNGAPGILATAAGYTMNAKPGPNTMTHISHFLSRIQEHIHHILRYTKSLKAISKDHRL